MILLIIQIVLLSYFGFIVFYLLIISLASLFRQKKKPVQHNIERKFAILIPGFKEDKVILEAANDALQQNYSQHLFDVIVIADSFLPETLEKLRELPIRLIEVAFENSTKAKSINKALDVLPDDYDIALILDADNLMEKDFVRKINEAFSRGSKCVQGHRIAKNMETSMATLDALSEEVNNKLFRKGHRVLGLSAAIIGSGVAFNYKHFKEIMKYTKAIGGFDKELELKLIKDKVVIEYCENALLYDEKVSHIENFSKQRRRWISAHFVYFIRSLDSVFYEVFVKVNIDYFIKVIQFASPPRLLLIGFLFFFTLISIFINKPSITILWGVIFLVSVLSIVFAIPTYFYNKATLSALVKIPQTFLVMFFNLFRLRGANKKFIHTQHGISGKN